MDRSPVPLPAPAAIPCPSSSTVRMSAPSETDSCTVTEVAPECRAALVSASTAIR